MVNSQIAVWSRTDLTRVSISSLHAFIGDPNNTPYCDVQVQWDPSAGRWLFVFLLCDTSASTQAFIFGWSKSADPSDLTNGWCAFAATTNPYLFDYPKLGHNSNYVIFGGNLFNVGVSPSNPPFATAAIAWVAKPANGVIATCPTTAPVVTATAANPLKNGDGVTNTFTPVPVNTITSSGDGYVVSAYDPSAATQHKLAVWHLDASGILHQHADITVANFTFPSFAPQLNGTSLIDTLDARLTQAIGDPISGIWTQHTINGPGGRSVVRWYEIKVAGTVASLAQEGEISSTTDFVFNGAISPRFDALGAAVFYNRSSPTIDPVIAGQDRLSSTPAGSMEPGEVVLASSTASDVDGSCNFNGTGVPCRWGDYSGASPDPVHTNLVWGTNEFITPTPSGPTYPAWADENFAVLFVGTPTNVTALAGDNDASVRWMPARSDPGTPITTYTVTTYSGANVVKTTTVPGQVSTATVSGLTNGVTYTFTVIANTADGSSPESLHSNAVTPGRAAVQAPPAPTPTRDPAPPAPPAPTPAGR